MSNVNVGESLPDFLDDYTGGVYPVHVRVPMVFIGVHLGILGDYI